MIYWWRILNCCPYIGNLQPKPLQWCHVLNVSFLDISSRHLIRASHSTYPELSSRSHSPPKRASQTAAPSSWQQLHPSSTQAKILGIILGSSLLLIWLFHKFCCLYLKTYLKPTYFSRCFVATTLAMLLLSFWCESPCFSPGFLHSLLYGLSPPLSPSLFFVEWPKQFFPITNQVVSVVFSQLSSGVPLYLK